jgi:hypothetical protein
MSQSSLFAKNTDRWTNELWNLSLFPVSTRDERELTPSGLENVDERRRHASIHRPLRVSLESSGGNLF